VKGLALLDSPKETTKTLRAVPHFFFDRPTLTVARDLIGCYLVIKKDGKVLRYVITETEAYDGLEDLASHASRGKTKRNEIMFRHAGYIYVYFTYGIHWMLNIVTGPVGYPAAVLIRGVQTRDGTSHYNGPAKLTKALGITGAFNGQTVSRKTGLWVEAPKSDAPRHKIKTTPRIGIDYAGPIWSQKHYRFLLAS
jgi:DNA-3-methyladenine glycosylase